MNTTTTLASPPAVSRGGLFATLRAWTQDFAPILSTLKRHKIAAGLIVLEVALTCTIVTNALHLIQTRIHFLQADSGLAESELLKLDVRGSKPVPPERARAFIADDLARLRALPGVTAATVSNQIAFGDNVSHSGVSLEPDNKGVRQVATQYLSDDQFIPTLGLKLTEGRNFRPDEVQLADDVFSSESPKLGQVIINREMARRLFPGRSALGQAIYVWGDSPSMVIGVVETLTHPQLHRADGEVHGAAMLFPVRGGGSYLVRVAAGQVDRQLKAATAALQQADTSRVVTTAKSITEMRNSFFAQDRAMAWLMGGVCAALLLVTAMGIVGLASFWVQQRTRMIGTRRALGATQGQILRYFLLENLLLTTTGIVIGLVGALGLSQLLMQSYALPRLPWFYLPAGALTLWVLGQLAVWVPARRAARLSPVAALRA